MENPAKLLRRAKQSRGRKTVHAAPAPVVQHAPQSSGLKSGHANYSALMRSHDRISSRHIAPGGGA